MGASGGIMALGNIAPEQCYTIYNYTKTGEYEGARNLQLKTFSRQCCRHNPLWCPRPKGGIRLDWLLWWATKVTIKQN